ncbi:MAG TPA: hypothetical protein VFP87_11695, partial [Chitinophagaceae bacterium]|nr:hypothetical protein [Chitinophagaceae bacterium]
IDPKFLSLFNSIIQSDTIRFNSPTGNNKTFVITKVDSIVSNRRALLINERPYKVVRAYFKEVGPDTTLLERENEIEVAKDPQSLTSGITIHLNNLYFSDTILDLHHDTLYLNLEKFTNYYLFQASLKLKNPDDVKFLYIDVPNGFLGFKTLSGEVWVKRK